MKEENTPLLSLIGVHKTLRKRPVLKEISFSVARGERVLLIGPNGAGKSTLLRLCAGLSRPSKGEITAEGRPVQPGSVGYLGHAIGLYGELTVRENLALAATLGKVKGDFTTSLHTWGLKERAEYRIDELSKGLQARAALARTFLFERSVLLLDEPTSPLDAHAVDLLLRTLSELSPSHALIMATHDIARLQQFPTRVILIVDGIIQRDSSQIEGASPQEACARVIQEYGQANR